LRGAAPIALAFAGCLTAATPLAAQTSSPDCYDVIVSAVVLHQQPTIMEECDDCIIMSWPWFLDLDVRRVVEGRASRGPMTVLAVLHTGYRRDLGPRRWWLRRNTLGGFNLLRFAEDEPPARCPADSEPARPYYRPGPDQTLADVRRAAEVRNGVYGD
jgi:hypothetical protein